MRTKEFLHETRPLYANCWTPKQWKPGIIHFCGVIAVEDCKYWARIRLCETQDGRLFAKLELQKKAEGA
jgi:hypothetical protein